MALRWLLILVLFLASCNLEQAPATLELPTATQPENAIGCDEIIDRAITMTDNLCSVLTRNQACYGHENVTADFATGLSGIFDNPGDRSQLAVIQRLATSPLNEQTQEWGIALLSVQANLPDTLPGQNVHFILFGEASIAGLTSDIQAVTLSTGIGQIRCASAPQSAILVQSPGGTRTQMRFNGASVELGSTLYITATANNEMTLATLEGSASITAFNQTQIVLPGAQVRLPLGSTDGLQVIGPPSAPEPYNLNNIQRAPLSLLPVAVELPQPLVPQAQATSVPPSAPLATAQPPACVPRADWQAAYTIQPGDTLFNIAQRYNLSVADLQSGNCIADANIISVGQTLRVPFQLAPTVPPAPTATSRPTQAQIIAPTITDTPFVPPSDTPRPSNKITKSLAVG